MFSFRNIYKLYRARVEKLIKTLSGRDNKKDNYLKQLSNFDNDFMSGLAIKNFDI